MKGAWIGCAFAVGLTMFAGPSLAQTPPPAPAIPASPATASQPPAAHQPGAPPPAAVSKPASSPPAHAAAPAAPGEPPPPPPGPPPGFGPNDADQGAPGVPNNSTTVTLDVPPRPVVLLTAKAKWDGGFKTIKDTLERVKGAADKAGLKITGHPLAMFTQEDDNGFDFTAMLPVAAGSKATLTDGVTLGQSPAGKAIKFQHRGPYDDIDSTYDLVTAYLDEKGLEAQNFFIEEYLTSLTSAEDPYLGVDIYVFLKP
ncbi:MAG: GyrI-like domain-containing protein [Methylovirgula sp.]|uniref:GyrI-like domain-containing protein n=1 Tax=Methylovirgula sp. TaxID=1978224 RepID=UPI0030765026